MVRVVQAVVVNPSVPGRLALQPVETPVPLPSQTLVRVAAVSLNLGEVRRATVAPAGSRRGWDVAGSVEQAAADGSGPPVGARVVGFLESGGWAEQVAVPTNSLAALPDGVSFAQASTLPVAGLTALRTLAKGGLLVGRSVLVTGASGGVGHFACQLGRLAGARIVGLVRAPSRVAAVREAGANEVAVGEDASAAHEQGPFDVILESLGGASLAAALGMLAPGGVCVSFGTSANPDVTFDARRFYMTGSASLYGFILFYEAERDPVSRDLRALADLVAGDRLRPHIELEAPWTQIADVARRLWDRHIPGKAVLHLSE